MEVHAHSHTERKKFTHYLWEFLMLFLAVFCGFLAENQREHIVEAHRANEYAKSLLSDLKEDTTEINAGIRQNAFMVAAFDSCISIGMMYIGKSSIPGKFYYYSRFATNAYAIDWNTSTLTQLLQSGNLRYFKNKELVTKINNYYAMQGWIGSNNQTDYLHRNLIGEIRSRLVSAKYYQAFAPLDISQEMEGHSQNDTLGHLMSQQLSCKPCSTDIMEEFVNNLLDRKARNERFVDELYPDALNAAKEIIDLLRTEYHLK